MKVTNDEYDDVMPGRNVGGMCNGAPQNTLA